MLSLITHVNSLFVSFQTRKTFIDIFDEIRELSEPT